MEQLILGWVGYPSQVRILSDTGFDCPNNNNQQLILRECTGYHTCQNARLLEHSCRSLRYVSTSASRVRRTLRAGRAAPSPRMLAASDCGCGLTAGTG